MAPLGTRVWHVDTAPVERHISPHGSASATRRRAQGIRGFDGGNKPVESRRPPGGSPTSAPEATPERTKHNVQDGDTKKTVWQGCGLAAMDGIGTRDQPKA